MKIVGRSSSRKSKKNNTRDSNVVPHRSTNRARHCLTSQSERDAVLSMWYGRSCPHCKFFIHLFHFTLNNNCHCFVHKSPQPHSFKRFSFDDLLGPSLFPSHLNFALSTRLERYRTACPSLRIFGPAHRRNHKTCFQKAIHHVPYSTSSNAPDSNLFPVYTE